MALILPEFCPPCHCCTVEGSRKESWLPGQQRIKPLLCLAADWLRQVPPPAILNVGVQREGSLIIRRGTRLPSQPEIAASWSTQGLPDQTSSISRGSSGPSFSASSSHSGHRWQCLWGQQLQLSSLANTERLRLRHLALCKDCRTGIYGYEVSLQACSIASGLGDREWGSTTFILSQAGPGLKQVWQFS